MSQTNGVLRMVPPKRNNKSFTPVLLPSKEEQEAAYEAALELVASIDEHLAKGTKHYRTTSGRLLRTLDEVVNAIMTNTLQTEEEAVENGWQQLARAA